MHLFYSTNITQNTLILTGEEHTHCIRVLRHKLSDQIQVTDGKGNRFTGSISVIGKSETTCDIVSVSTLPKSDFKLAIAISPTKNPSRLEWFAEKAVEIGVDEIILFQAHRTEKKWTNNSRLEKIMVSAMKQSLNLHLPKLSVFPSFMDMATYCTKFQNRYIAHCDDPQFRLSDIHPKNEPAVALIGPEGDFTADEISYAEQHQFKPVSLGNNRLRTETAGLTALIMMMY